MNVLNYISSTATEVISKSIVAPLRVVSNKVTEYRTKEEKDEKPDRIYETNKYEQYKSLTYEPINIIDNLYLGHAINAGSYYVLKKLNIGLIMNVTNEIDNYFEDCKEFEYAKYDISDNGKDKINNHLINSYLKIIDYQKTYPDKIFYSLLHGCKSFCFSNFVLFNETT